MCSEFDDEVGAMEVFAVKEVQVINTNHYFVVQSCFETGLDADDDFNNHYDGSSVIGVSVRVRGGMLMSSGYHLEVRTLR